jgi:HD-GYP domain-containing protein (c-di-GMP phosphodiesterase class II)
MVAVVCDLAARTLDSCSDEHRRSLRRAALTMNIGMTRLQDQLALQATAVTPEQRALIDGHAARGVELLQEMGVTDELWLEAVAHHHDAPSGKLAAQSIEMQLARLIQRADVFTARMSPRKVRPALSAALAAKGAYFDEHEKPDEAGSLVIKAMGIYPAGSFVQLVSGELAVVLRRGRTANKPFLAGIADRHGIPYVQPVARATDDPSSAIVRGVPPNDVRVRIPVERLLKLAR